MKTVISTHTSLAGRDNIYRFLAISKTISTHTSLAGRDRTPVPEWILLLLFLLTRPSRDVTSQLIRFFRLSNISTHTSLAGRDMVAKDLKTDTFISTHTSLAGRDLSICLKEIT